jgi:hypothetical protein
MAVSPKNQSRRKPRLRKLRRNSPIIVYSEHNVSVLPILRSLNKE